MIAEILFYVILTYIFKKVNTKEKKCEMYVCNREKTNIKPAKRKMLRRTGRSMVVKGLAVKFNTVQHQCRIFVNNGLLFEGDDKFPVFLVDDKR